MSKKLFTSSRRHFLTTSAAGIPLLMAAPNLMASSAKNIHWDRETDVLIVGGGQAGLCAAITAREAGAKVLLIEKAPMWGGHTGMSGSGFYAGGTHIQAAAGVQDSVKENIEDAIRRGEAANRFIKRDTSTVMRVYEEAPDALKWMESLGVKFLPKPVIGIGKVPRVHYVAPGYKRGSPVLIQTLKTHAEKIGVELAPRTTMLKLHTESGTPTLGVRVVGIQAKDSSGKVFNLLAKKGVILACGGFANGKEMVKRFHPYLANLQSLGSPYNTGDGIRAAMEIGANLLTEYNGFGMNMLFVGTHKGQSFGLPMTEAPLIVVGKDGTRFNDESKGYLAACHKMVEKKLSVANWIFDEKTYQKFKTGCLKPLFETEVVNQYPTMEALAEGEKINKAQLLQTVARYNNDVASGKDQVLGRTTLLQTIDQGPYYAFECGPRIYTSYSGLQINRDGQVIATDGNPIPGLFAAGDITGHLGYQCSLGGGGVSGLVMATVYGRTCAKSALQMPTLKV